MAAISDSLHNSLRDIVDVFFRQKRKIALVFILVFAGVSAYSFVAPAVYQSEAKLLVRSGRENYSVDPAVEGATINVSQTREGDVKSETAVLCSRELVEDVVNAISPDVFLASPSSVPSLVQWMYSDEGKLVPAGQEVREGEVDEGLRKRGAVQSEPYRRAVKKVSDNLAVSVENGTNIIQASFEARDPALARGTLQMLLDSYMKRHIQVHAAKASPDFFEAETSEMRMELQRREEALSAFRKEHGIAQLEQQTQTLLTQIGEVQRQIAEETGDISGSRARVASLEETLAERSETMELERTTGKTNWAADDYKSRLTDLRMKEADLAARYADDYRPLVEVRERISEIQALLAKEGDTHTEVTVGLNTSYRELELSLANERALLEAGQAQYDALKKDLADLEARLDELSGYRVELERLEREVELADEEYREYRKNWQHARISQALDVNKVSNVSIVQYATMPLEPVRPKKVRSMVLGALVGILGGIALAFLSDYLDDTFKTGSDVARRLDLPVLATISDREFKGCT